MAPQSDHKVVEQLSQTTIQELLHEKLRQAVRLTLTTVLEEEVDAYIQAGRYERNEQRQDQRNGSYTRSLGTTMGVVADLAVPRTRKGFRTQVFQSYKRRQQELDEAIAGMFIGGVSNEQTGQVVEALTGTPASGATVSRVFQTLRPEYESWRTRRLASHYLYGFADGSYFNVIYDGESCKMPILAVIGINARGEKDVLGFTVGDKENQHAWEDLFTDLKERGVAHVDLWITDGHQAMINAIASQFPTAQRQRCIVHKMENVLGYIPTHQQEAIKPELKAIFYQTSREEADIELAAFWHKYENIYPSAIACLRRDLDASLAFYDFPRHHWRAIRTTNLIERMFGETKKRSKKMAAPFRNEKSCLLLFFAVVRTIKFKRIRIA